MDIAYEYLLINRVFILSWGNFKLLETFRLKIQNSKNYTHGKMSEKRVTAAIKKFNVLLWAQILWHFKRLFFQFYDWLVFKNLGQRICNVYIAENPAF